ncbi:MAG: HAMP domain-containing histidine kinase [Flavobacteriales bacterium]|nr:HAMP domain-containing histidine kinase [Flavobacteriales bacterium]MCB9166265.1 HAMP domain-containing histidine kinase [Flavobacteriales bacterium]
MTIRDRLTWQFVLLVSLILGVAFGVIYSSSSTYRYDDFHERLKARATNIANLLLQVEEVDEALLEKIETSSPLRLTRECVWVIDVDGTVVYHGGEDRPRPPRDAQVRLLNGGPERNRDEGGLEGMELLYSGSGQRAVVSISAMDVYGQRKMGNLGRVLIATFIAGVLLIFFIGRVYAARSLAPLRRLSEEIASIGVDHLDERVDEGNGRDELAVVARAFNELLERLDDAFKGQRGFIANASHELRTPLTAVSGQLEVLLLRDRQVSEYRTAITSVLEDLRNLRRLVDSLLELAQSEGGRSAVSFRPVRMDELIWQARSEVLRAGAGRQVEVGMESVDEEAQWTVQGDERLLRSVLFNLMENGCKYSPDQRVRVEMHTAGERLRIAFVDQGIGIPEEDQQNVLEPFRRAQNVMGKAGHGIGLSLARRIVLLHHGAFRFRSEVGKGTTVTIWLPQG